MRNVRYYIDEKMKRNEFEYLIAEDYSKDKEGME